MYSNKINNDRELLKNINYIESNKIILINYRK